MSPEEEGTELTLAGRKELAVVGIVNEQGYAVIRGYVEPGERLRLLRGGPEKERQPLELGNASNHRTVQIPKVVEDEAVGAKVIVDLSPADSEPRLD